MDDLKRNVILAARYAARFAAETVCYEPPQWKDPTDEAFAAHFAGCVRVPPSDMYPLIRDAFLAEYSPTNESES